MPTPRHLASFETEWRCPIEHPPPLGTTILILTRYGVLIKGIWQPGQNHVGWSPMLKVPDFIKQRIGKREEDW